MKDAGTPPFHASMRKFLPLARTWVFLVFCALLLSGAAAVVSYRDPFTKLSALPFGLALLAVAAAAILHDRAHGVPSWRLRRTDLLLMGALTLAAAAFRLYRLDDFLPPLHGDEGEMGMMALLALHGPEPGKPPLALFGTAWLAHPTLFYYLQAAALLLPAGSTTALRLLSVAFGALCIPLIYLIGLIGWGRVAAVVAAWLMAVSHLYIQYSRIALNNIETVWFTMLLMLMFAIIHERSRNAGTSVKMPAGNDAPALLPAAVAGLAVGLGQYLYFGSRLMGVISVPLILILVIRKRLALSQLVILGCAAALSFLPLAVHHIVTWPSFLGRVQGVSVFSAEGLRHALGPQSVWPDDLPALAIEQLRRNLGFFTGSGDISAFYLSDLPAFDPVTLALGWIGLIIAIAHCKRYHEMALLIWLGLGILLGGVVTNDAPNGPRLIVAAAGLFLLAGICVHHGFRLAAAHWPKAAPVGLIILAAGLAGATGYLNYQIYFVTYARLAPNVQPIAIAHDASDGRQQYDSHLLGAPEIYAAHGAIRLAAQDAGLRDLAREEIAALGAAFRARKAPGKGLMFIVMPVRMADLPLLVSQFPGGRAEERKDGADRLLYTIYRAPPPAGAGKTD